jgi:hypothetical protein
MPGEPVGIGTVIASCWMRDDAEPLFAEVLILMPAPPFYVTRQIEVRGQEWVAVPGTSTTHENIIPATEDYSDRVGGY